MSGARPTMHKVVRSVDLSTGKTHETVFSGEYTVIARCPEDGELREFSNGSSLWCFPPEVEARKKAAHAAAMQKPFSAIDRARPLRASK